MDELKEKFSTGKTPTGADFAELIDFIAQGGFSYEELLAAIEQNYNGFKEFLNNDLNSILNDSYVAKLRVHSLVDNLVTFNNDIPQITTPTLCTYVNQQGMECVNVILSTSNRTYTLRDNLGMIDTSIDNFKILREYIIDMDTIVIASVPCFILADFLKTPITIKNTNNPIYLFEANTITKIDKKEFLTIKNNFIIADNISKIHFEGWHTFDGQFSSFFGKKFRHFNNNLIQFERNAPIVIYQTTEHPYLAITIYHANGTVASEIVEDTRMYELVVETNKYYQFNFANNQHIKMIEI